MKKLVKAFAVFAAVAMLGTSFFSCKADDDDDKGPSAGTGSYPVGERVVPTAPAQAGTVKLNGEVKASIAAAIEDIGASGDYVIELSAGTYEEDGLRYQGGANITIKGPEEEFGTKVLIKGKGANMDSEGGNQAGRELLEIAGSGNVVLKYITLWNNFEKDGDCQAEAFGFDSTGKAAAYNCSFISRQDTTRTTGKAWFYKCYVEGDVDFLWMEQTGKVALYEDCELRAALGRQKTDSKGTKAQVSAYFTAPRVNVVDEAVYGKGLVIYNSDIIVEKGLTAYLFRNPWSSNSAYYNNVAYVASRLHGKVAGLVEKDSHKAMYDKLNPCGGFLVSNLAGLNNMKKGLAEAEYAGRNNILNRVFDSETNSMHKDFADTWDLSALEAEFNATADSSKSILAGEKELVMKEYDFVAVGNAMTSEEAVDTAEWKIQQANKDQSVKGHGPWMAAAGNSQSGVDSYIVLKNVPKFCKVTFLSCAYGAGSGVVTGPNGFETTFECNKVITDGGNGGAFVYNGGVEGDLTLTFTAGNAWVHGVAIREYETLTPATGITVKAPKTTIFTDEAVQLTATIAPADVTLKAQKWTSSDASTVFVSDKGLIMGMKVGKATITVATKDGTDKTASVEITVVEKTAKPVAGRSYSYPMQGGVGNPFFSDDLLFQCKGDSDNGSHGIVMKKDSKAIVDVAGNVKVILYRCRYDNGDTCIVTDKAGNRVATVIFPVGAGGGVADTDTLEFAYVGPATTLTMTFQGEKGACYLHRVDVEPLTNIVAATGITVTAAENATEVNLGETLQLTATVAPENATVKAVTWSSSDETIATVDGSGLVKALKAADEVTITATSTLDEVSGSIKLKIVKPETKADSFFVATADNGTFVDGDLSVTIANTNPNGHGVEIKNDHSSTVTVSLPAGEYILGIGMCKYGDSTEFEVECANEDFKKDLIGEHVFTKEDCYKDARKTPYGQYWIISSATDMSISINTPNGTNRYMPFIRATSTVKPKAFVATADNGTFVDGDLSVTIANTNPNGHGVEIKNDHSSTVTVSLPAGEYILGIGMCKYGDSTEFEVECANEDFKKDLIGEHVFTKEDCYKDARKTPYGQYWIISSATDMSISINTPNGTNRYMPFILVD